MAAITGWEVLIANVGDSCAYLDTGVEVILVRTFSVPFNGADVLNLTRQASSSDSNQTMFAMQPHCFAWYKHLFLDCCSGLSCACLLW